VVLGQNWGKMVNVTILVSAVVSFLATFLLLPYIIKYLKRIDIIVKDVHKQPIIYIPISGGLAVMVGLFLGLMSYIFLQTFVDKANGSLVFLLAAMCSILIIALVGFVDDLLVKFNKKQNMYMGLKQWQKPFLVIPAAIPLMAVNSGITQVYIPFLGSVDLGLLYPLIIVPIAVVGAANMVNLLAGLNGLESGLGIIYTGMLGIFAYVHGSMLAAAIAFITFGALVAFYIFNKVPAKVLPGDSLTYLLGAVLASIAILGNMEKAALIISIPFFIEFFLKLRGKFKKQTIGYIKNGKIHSHYKEIYSIPHIFMRTGKFTEKQIVLLMILIQLIFASLIWVL